MLDNSECAEDSGEGHVKVPRAPQPFVGLPLPSETESLAPGVVSHVTLSDGITFQKSFSIVFILC